MLYKTPYPSLISFFLLMIGCVLFLMSTIYTLYKIQHSEKWSCNQCLQLSRLVIGCGVVITFLFGLCSVFLASVITGKSSQKHFWGYKKNICARILNGFFLLITFFLTISWFGITCLTFIPLYGFLYIYFVVCNNRYGTAGGSFVNILNEINQHAHRLDEKPAHFKLSDICQPSYRDYFSLSIVTTVSSILVILSLIFLMIAQGANHAHIHNDRNRYELAHNSDQDIEDTKM
ncbi:unnamed protein product [Rotaria sordida]|uniref:Uncharacterized protein n=1 Tax=Rotaria sordida TaxID=392033 RepID=A0A814TGP9_9BILA|nr:unnamed protein product [Rotaria sordida]CAF1161716.1 unnamed protein product [Rotaria sordida]CAF1166850.1 unnamed protein product [Rotaria sordida]CAF1167030.1 unnamed protein product [Rotaria sordida]CAF3729623.1 unnamed protein product [Rotaria sordida]